jgi:predicted ThiF/HesA family dinucleotide-utilizing enzyme
MLFEKFSGAKVKPASTISLKKCALKVGDMALQIGHLRTNEDPKVKVVSIEERSGPTGKIKRSYVGHIHIGSTIVKYSPIEDFEPL